MLVTIIICSLVITGENLPLSISLKQLALTDDKVEFTAHLRSAMKNVTGRMMNGYCNIQYWRSQFDFNQLSALVHTTNKCKINLRHERKSSVPSQGHGLTLNRCLLNSLFSSFSSVSIHLQLIKSFRRRQKTKQTITNNQRKTSILTAQAQNKLKKIKPVRKVWS